MTTTVKAFVSSCGGIASVRELAEFLEVSERSVREWAHENDVPRAGNVFAFRVKDAEALAADVESEDDDDQDEDADQQEEEVDDDDEEENEDDDDDDDA